jgi:hypothetical protein
VNRYAAQKQFWAERKKFQQGDIVDEEMLAKLRVAADKEKEQNELEYRKMLGSLVQASFVYYFSSPYPLLAFSTAPPSNCCTSDPINSSQCKRTRRRGKSGMRCASTWTGRETMAPGFW